MPPNSPDLGERWCRRFKSGNKIKVEIYEILSVSGLIETTRLQKYDIRNWSRAYFLSNFMYLPKLECAITGDATGSYVDFISVDHGADLTYLRYFRESEVSMTQDIEIYLRTNRFLRLPKPNELWIQAGGEACCTITSVTGIQVTYNEYSDEILSTKLPRFLLNYQCTEDIPKLCFGSKDEHRTVWDNLDDDAT